MRIEFEQPSWLWVLLVLPAILAVLRLSLVDAPRAQIFLQALTRSIILLLLAAALASALWVTRTTALSILVLSDLSGSVADAAAAQTTNLWNALRTQLEGNKRAALAVFAGEPRVIAGFNDKEEAFDKLTSLEKRDETSIEKALLSSWQQMPQDSIRRIVLISDGNETVGDALAAARRGAAYGYQVFTIPSSLPRREEVLLEDLLVPTETRKGASFNVTAVAHASSTMKTVFTLYRDGFRIDEREIELKAGRNTLTFQESRPSEGLVKYELRVRAANDFYADNNVSSGIVHVAGEPRVLLLEGEEKEARYLARALEAENIRVEVREGRGMPGSLEELAAFDAVILSDVPATDLSVRQMNILRTYIEDLGGGFIMLGGEQSFGIGGYYRTSIEEALPVRMRSEKKKDTPSLALMLVIDKSGSMHGEKMDLARQAAIATVEVLSSRDLVGVIAFDGEPYTVVDLQPANNGLAIVQNIERIEAGGGTSIYPPLVMAEQYLSAATATFKHVILLTDGVSQPGDFEGVVSQMAHQQITVSTVAVGEDADLDLLQAIARWGRGRHYFTTEATDIPQIFTKETMTASKSALVEEPFLPQVLKDDQVIRSIDWENAPFLFGYVITTPKPTAHVSLMTERGDPLLASWRFGLGKAVAFTSDAKSRWAADWVRWPGYSQFWAQMVRDVLRVSSSRGAEASIAIRHGKGSVTIDNVSDAGEFVNGLETTMQIIQPDLTIKPLPAAQVAPGRYSAEFDATQTGSYLVRIRQAQRSDQGEQSVTDFTRAITVSYKPEYRHLGLNEDFLRELATASGGKYNPTVEELLHVTEEDAVAARKKIWPWLVATALILFLVDVALRRLDLSGHRFWGGAPARYG